jgi:hypothetical protein
LEERLSKIQASIDKTQKKIDSYTLSMMTHGQDSTKSDIAWLDGLIDAERRGARPEQGEKEREAVRGKERSA